MFMLTMSSVWEEFREGEGRSVLIGLGTVIWRIFQNIMLYLAVTNNVDTCLERRCCIRNMCTLWTQWRWRRQRFLQGFRWIVGLFTDWICWCGSTVIDVRCPKAGRRGQYKGYCRMHASRLCICRPYTYMDQPCLEEGCPFIGQKGKYQGYCKTHASEVLCICRPYNHSQLCSEEVCPRKAQFGRYGKFCAGHVLCCRGKWGFAKQVRRQAFSQFQPDSYYCS